MPIYGEDSYENALIELFTSTLNYEHIYGPNVERNWHSPLLTLFWKILFTVLIPKLHILP